MLCCIFGTCTFLFYFKTENTSILAKYVPIPNFSDHTLILKLKKVNPLIWRGLSQNKAKIVFYESVPIGICLRVATLKPGGSIQLFMVYIRALKKPGGINTPNIYFFFDNHLPRVEAKVQAHFSLPILINKRSWKKSNYQQQVYTWVLWIRLSTCTEDTGGRGAECGAGEGGRAGPAGPRVEVVVGMVVGVGVVGAGAWLSSTSVSEGRETSSSLLAKLVCWLLRYAVSV